MPKVLVDDKARQGPRGRPILYVLVASLVLLACYMIFLLTWAGTTSPPAQNPAPPPSSVAPTSSGPTSPTPQTPPR